MVRENITTTKRKWKIVIFGLSLTSLCFCMTQILLPPPFGMMDKAPNIVASPYSNGCQQGLTKCICPRQTICADSMFSMILLAVARCSVFLDYPLYMCLFLTKARNINNFLQTTFLSEWINFTGTHSVHAQFGVVVGIETTIHSLLHLLRWLSRDDDIKLLWESKTGITGLIAMILTQIIVWPMALPLLRKKVAFEFRKFIHYAAWCWALAIMFHAPTNRIFWLIGVPFFIQVLDWFVGIFLRIHKIDNVFFKRSSENCITVQFKYPKSLHPTYHRISFCYIMLPWVSKYQWHAFSLFCSMPNEKEDQINYTLCIKVTGDWTKALYELTKAPSYRLAYIYGPFTSPFTHAAVNLPSIVAVATGIGITPVLATAQNYSNTRSINVVWICKDPGLVEYVLTEELFSSWSSSSNSNASSLSLIYYTGERNLVLPDAIPSNVVLIQGKRPSITKVVSGIITSIENKDICSRDLFGNHRSKKVKNQQLGDLFNRMMATYTNDELFSIARSKTLNNMSAMFNFRKVSVNAVEEMLVELMGVPEHHMYDFGVDPSQFENSVMNQSEFDHLLGVIGSTFKVRSLKVQDKPEYVQIPLGNDTSSTFDEELSYKQTEYYNESFEEDGPTLSPTQQYPEWGLFYCGGSNELRKTLKYFSAEHGIQFASENFSW